jgi:hypothetical protein
VSAQLEIVLLDGSQGGSGGQSQPSSVPSYAPQATPQQPAPQTPPQTPVTPPAVEAGRFLSDEDKARFEEADANYRHENPEPSTPSNAGAIDFSNTEVVNSLKEIADAMGLTSDAVRKLIEDGRLSGDVLGPQASASVAPTQTPTEPATDAAVTNATGTVQDAIEEITGRVTRALDDLQKKIDDARATERPAPRETTSQPRQRTVGGQIVGRLGRRIGRTRAGRAIGRVASSRTGRAVRRIGGGIASRVAGRAAAGGAASAAGGAAVGGASALGSAGVAVGAIVAPIAITVAALGALAMGLKKVSDIANSLGDELEGFSGAINAQRAMAEARMLSLQISRADRVGPQVAQIEAAQSRLNEAMYEVQTSIYEVLLKLAPKVEMATDSITAGLRLAIAFKETSELALDKNNPREFVEAAEAQRKFAVALFDVFGEDKNIDARDDILMDIFKQQPGEGVRPRANKKPFRIP